MPEATSFFKSLYEDRREGNKEKCKEAVWSEVREWVGDFLESEVEKVIRSMKVGKADGSAVISNEVIRMLSKAIVRPLTAFFNEILETEVVPIQWLRSEIFLLHIKGCRENINNYRPISLSSNIGKMSLLN